MDAFDSDVLIDAATAGHPVGARVARLFDDASVARDDPVGIGSVLLLPEVLIKPLRHGQAAEAAGLRFMLSRLDLHPVDAGTARVAVALGATYGLGTADAVHLATAVLAGADRFITNNRRDFTKSITEVDVTYADEV